MCCVSVSMCGREMGGRGIPSVFAASKWRDECHTHKPICLVFSFSFPLCGARCEWLSYFLIALVTRNTTPKPRCMIPTPPRLKPPSPKTISNILPIFCFVWVLRVCVCVGFKTGISVVGSGGSNGGWGREKQ